MKTYIVGSVEKSSGKTGVIVGLKAALGKPAGYMKPFGDRLRYLKKRLWDYDSALITQMWDLKENPEDISIGFEHIKLQYKYDAVTIEEKLCEMANRTGAGKDILFVEAGNHLHYGLSVNLDALTMARALKAELVVVAGGPEGVVADDLAALKKNTNLEGITLKGVIFNKIHDLEDFKETHLPRLSALGLPILGCIPNEPKLTHFTMGYLAEILFSKILAGEQGLSNVVEHIVIGAMSVGSALRQTSFNKHKKLVITPGDRTDMIQAALEGGTSGIILTNNILPPASVISRAEAEKTPLLLVSSDTYQTAKQVDSLEPLLTKDDHAKAELLERLVRDHVDLSKFKS
jgi:hypothetical protein